MLARQALKVCSAMAVAVAVVAVTYGQAIPPPEAATPVASPADDWDAMTVDIGIDRRIVDTSGAAKETPAQKKVLRWELSQRGGQWRNVVTVLSTFRPKVQAATGEMIELENPFEIVRFEEDEGSAPRFFDNRGNEVKMPRHFPKRWTNGSPGPGWPAALPTAPQTAVPASPPKHVEYKRFARTLLVTQQDRASRLMELTSEYGLTTGRVRGLGRLVRLDGNELQEILVDDALSVPVQVNVGRDGVLVSRTSYSYTPRGTTGDFLCERITTEELVPGAQGTRTIVELSFSNLRLERRR